ncbi:CoA-binding protein [Dissulfurimicrobium hydrothermale]|uniref:CoA-binding protein n=1 Tax=Dissulfurimicrobium hydrothermale TaxID=1750598 RepID=UPI001EDB4215|nr:CoA-binding protein [Dissulfurimicrobium hydrothermale]UKL13212.1 CoA-binding protein [Dissulfurimicrobium hydrothermale]
MTIIQDRDKILQLIKTARTIAVVGISPDTQRASYLVTQRVIGQGIFKVYLVNPVHAGAEILGRKVLAFLKDVPEPIDIVDVFRRPDATAPIFEDAIKTGAKIIWLQPGTENDEIISRYQDRIMIVKDACLGVMTGQAFASSKEHVG